MTLLIQVLSGRCLDYHYGVMLVLFPVSCVICKLAEFAFRTKYIVKRIKCITISCYDERPTMGMGRLANTIFLFTIPTAFHCVGGVSGEVTGRSSLLFS